MRALKIVSRAGGTPVYVVGSEPEAAFLTEKRGLPPLFVAWTRFLPPNYVVSRRSARW